MRFHSKTSDTAFTITELVVVVGSLAAIAIICLPALAGASLKGARFGCSNNLRQLGIAWQCYNADAKGKLISSYPVDMGTGSANTNSWAPGYCGVPPWSAPGSASYGAPPFSSSSDEALRRGKLFKYLNSTAVFKCPANSSVTIQLTPSVTTNLARSYSMNCYMNGTARESSYTLYTNVSQLKKPSALWLLMDEDVASINDGMFMVDMSGKMVDLPGRQHGREFSWLFCDGRAELSPIKTDAFYTWTRNSLVGITNADWLKIANATTTPR